MLMHPTAFFTVTFRALLTMPAGAQFDHSHYQLNSFGAFVSGREFPFPGNTFGIARACKFRAAFPLSRSGCPIARTIFKGGTTTDPRMEQPQRKHRKIGPLQNPVSRKRRPSTVRLESYSAASPSIWLIPPELTGTTAICITSLGRKISRGLDAAGDLHPS
jgi:hypothetical protein